MRRLVAAPSPHVIRMTSCRDSNGDSPLHAAARGGCVAIVDGIEGVTTAAATVRNDRGESPLHLLVVGRAEAIEPYKRAVGAAEFARATATGDGRGRTLLHK